MAYYTSQQIEKAKQIDLLTYLQEHNPDELVYESRNSYSTRSHDSLKISNGMWFWFSRGIGGKSALDYLIIVEEMNFTQAVEHLLKQKGLERKVKIKKELTEKEKIDRLVLPDKDNNNYRVVSYLMSRGINKNIIVECINKGFIYQEYGRRNVVFVGYDDKNNPRYASVRGTTNSRYMHDCYGSDKAYSFRLSSIKENNSVHLFESAIDLLSYATLKELKKEHWDEENLLSLSGVFQTKKEMNYTKIPKTLTYFLNNNKNIDTIYLHLDNDEAGRNATKCIIDSLSVRYKIIDEPPKSGKDYNDYLCNILKINQKNNRDFSR